MIYTIISFSGSYIVTVYWQRMLWRVYLPTRIVCDGYDNIYRERRIIIERALR